jgi:hypothetical protein
MPQAPTPRLRPALLAALLLAGSAGLPAWAASSGKAAAAPSRAQQAQQTFRAEMAHCASGQAVQERRVCEQEARAALAANLRGHLADSNTSYQRNAQLRCEALPATGERELCLARTARAERSGSGEPLGPLVVPGSETPLKAN